MKRGRSTQKKKKEKKKVLSGHHATEAYQTNKQTKKKKKKKTDSYLYFVRKCPHLSTPWISRLLSEKVDLSIPRISKTLDK